MIEATLFIGAVIAGITQAIKLASPRVHGLVTIAVAVLTGVVIALIDTEIGVTDITVAEGVLIGLGAAGVAGVVKR